MSVDVSVVIVGYNSRDDLPVALDSLREHTAGVSYDVTVVDNASRDGTAQLIEREYPWVRLIARGANIGLSGAGNEGAAASGGEFIVALNPDVRFDHDVLGPLAAYLRAHPDAGVVAPKLLNPDGTLQLSCRAFPGYSTALFNRYSLLTRLLPGNRFSRRYLMAGFDHASRRDVDWVSGAAMMFPRALFERLGGWDAGVFMFNEDVDFCRRVHDAGFRVVYMPEVWLYHEIGVSKRAPARMIIARHRSMWRYYRKHLSRNLALDGVTATGIAARCALLLASSAMRGLGERLRRGGRARMAPAR